MKNRAVELFYAIAGLGAVLALVSVGQAVAAFGSRLAYTLRPWFVAGFWSLVIVLVLVLVVAAYFAFIWFRSWRYDIKIDQAGRAAATVRAISDHRQTWLVDPLGLSLINASHDWRLLIDPTQPEPLPDQWQAIRTIEFLKSQQPTRAIKAAEVPQLMSPAMPELLPIISTLPNLLIVGGKGTGKTTLMQWLAVLRSELGRVLVFDSHDHPAKWPAGYVIGNGRNYETIWKAMLALVSQLDQRYKDFAAGRRLTGQFERVDNFIDEFTLLPAHIKDLGGNVQSYSKPLLTEGRKVDLNLVWGIHSDRADALGLRGAKDLVECFDAVIYLKNVNGERFALVDFGDGIDKEQRYRLPGPFAGVAPQPATEGLRQVEWVTAPEAEAIEVDTDQPTPEEMAILTAFVDVRDNEPKFSYAEVCRRLGLTSGGKQFDRIRETLRKWGIEPI